MTGFSTAALPGTGFSTNPVSRPLMGGSAVGMSFGASTQSQSNFGKRQNSGYNAGGGTGNSYQAA